MHLGPETYGLLTLVAFAAGFIDAIAGGGGLLTVPAMLSAGISPIATLATNKLQSSFSSGTATYSFSRKGMIDWRTYWPQVIVILLMSGSARWSSSRSTRTSSNSSCRACWCWSPPMCC